MTEKQINPICRKHWEEATGRHAWTLDGALMLRQIHIHHIEYLLPSILAECNLNGNRAFAVVQTIYECLLEKYKP